MQEYFHAQFEHVRLCLLIKVIKKRCSEKNDSYQS